MADRTRATLYTKKKRKIFPYIILVIVFFFGSTGAYAGYLLNQAANAAEKANAPLSRGEKSDMRESVVQPLKDNVSLLIMGVDESETRKDSYRDATRTDALLYATFNMKEKSVKLLSIPRDSYTMIPKTKKKDKINHAHAYGGVEGTIDAVEHLLDVPVDYYVKVNFESFLEIVDLLGGIEVDVPVSFTEQDSKDRAGAIKIEKGLQTLNGEEALALARTRKIDSDLERGKRQMLIIEAIAKKAISANTLFKLDNLLSILGDNVKTNMTLSDITSFYKYAVSIGSLKMEKLQLEGTDGKIDGTYYYILDPKKLGLLQQDLRTHLELPAKKSTPTIPATGATKTQKEQQKTKQQPVNQKIEQPKQTKKEKQQSTNGTTGKPSERSDNMGETSITSTNKNKSAESTNKTDSANKQSVPNGTNN
ncbi:LCP family protein [Priestia taiwanensis]|uniref:LytR family transcriptional regulator n=1 Tax=Priestia taiwanensis TaxID=1347902 RepID=A0A917EUD6_9BACI|nr:LCP family protein [Priestia taiwanensis]MBM7364364.1 LCP family protein required for cell wall assembly [Priestia taiwanensis]GGE85025.1 LytR family transcriptional regulator [Priestia taiwanensis]